MDYENHPILLLLKKANPLLPTPAICVGEDKQVEYFWDKNEHHLELEILPDDKSAYFFYRNRLLEGYWGEDYVIGDPLPPYLIEKIATINWS